LLDYHLARPELQLDRARVVAELNLYRRRFTFESYYLISNRNSRIGISDIPEDLVISTARGMSDSITPSTRREAASPFAQL
jgi:hypothetical protein